VGIVRITIDDHEQLDGHVDFPSVEPDAFVRDEWFRHVSRTTENDLRAHQIALTYSKLSLVLDAFIHHDRTQGILPDDKRPTEPCNANWFHFATWGTLAVTRNIANERPPQRVDMLPLEAVRRWLTPLIIQARASNGQRVSRALAWGQRLMFVSMCYSVRYFLEWTGRYPDAEPDEFYLVAGQRPIEVARTIIDLGTAHEGTGHERRWIDAQRHLKPLAEALRYYIHARKTRDDTTRARCVLGANVLLTAIEQDLVNEAVGAVVDHIPQRIAAGVEWRIARWTERHFDVPSQITSLTLPFRYAAARQALDTTWSRMMTDQVFVMALPTETLRLGRDIPPLIPGQPYYPQPLRNLDDVAGRDRKEVLASVADLVESLDRTIGDGNGSAARDWRRWDERMNFATTLMRSRQQDGTLYWAPYATEDQVRIVRDELPKRSGDPSALEVQAPLEPFQS
jgi:hypothetical protein